jgi:hypothetical protein
MKILLILFYLSLIFNCTFAQSDYQVNTAISNILSNNINPNLHNLQMDTYEKLEGFKVYGNGFFNFSDYKGNVFLQNGEKLESRLYYNLYAQKIYMPNANTLGEIKDVILYFNLYDNKKILTFISSDSLKLKKKNFYQSLISNKKIAFYKLTFNTLIDNPESLGTGSKVYFLNTEYYISLNGNVPEKVKLSKKGFNKIIGNDEKYQKYIQENNIDFSVETDIIKLLEYVNS